MAHYFAKFDQVSGDIVARFDTRIYFKPHDGKRDGRCVGAVVCKNPGSAKTIKMGQWQALDLDGDNALPTLKSAFTKAFNKVGYFPQVGDYLQVLNLFLVCDPDLKSALRKWRLLDRRSMEDKLYKMPPFLFFAWGSDRELNDLRNEFLNKPVSQVPSFWIAYRKAGKKFEFEEKQGRPEGCDKVKHPQGLPYEFIERGLRSIWPKINKEFVA